jgi:hypothetical protein
MNTHKDKLFKFYQKNGILELSKVTGLAKHLKILIFNLIGLVLLVKLCLKMDMGLR